MSGLPSTRKGPAGAGVSGMSATGFADHSTHMLRVVQVRAVVQMFTSRAELLDKGETTTEHSKNQKEEADRLDKDKANTNSQSGGLFGGLFRPKAPSLKPVVDVDDGVVRCPSCAWELEDGRNCPGCGWQYRPDEDRTDYSGSDDLSDTDYDSVDEEIEMEEDEFGDIEDDDSVWGYADAVRGMPPDYFGDGNSLGYAQIRQIVDGVFQAHGFLNSHASAHDAHTDGSQYDEAEDDDYDEADSFIDDDENRAHDWGSESDRDTVVGSTHIQHPPLPPSGSSGSAPPSYIPFSDDEVDSDAEEEEDDEGEEREEDSDDENEDSEVEDSSMLPSTISSPSQAEGTSSSSLHDQIRSSPFFSTEAESDIPDNPTAAAYPWHSASSLSSDPENEPQNSSSPPRPMGFSRTTGSSARNAIAIDDSEDEQPVGPMRRGTQSRHVRFSPY